MDELNFEIPLKLMLPKEKRVTLILAGCGGTGSWLAPAVARIGKILIERFDTAASIYFIDPDVVEEKNIYRQNFCAAEIGENKAETLAMRFGLSWGIEIHAVKVKFADAVNRSRLFDNQTFVVGCVDRASARKEISNSTKDHDQIAWLDCGNSESYGQVVLGVNTRILDRFSIPGYCNWLPMPDVQHPELVSEQKVGKLFTQPESPLSCADMALQDSQGLAINQRMAAEAADYLVRMLITRDLKKFATYIDLESGTARSKNITEKAVKEYGKV